MGGAAGAPQGPGGGESAPIRAPMSLWRCSRIMHLLRDLHPTLLSALEGIVDQVRVTMLMFVWCVSIERDSKRTKGSRRTREIRLRVEGGRARVGCMLFLVCSLFIQIGHRAWDGRIDGGRESTACFLIFYSLFIQMIWFRENWYEELLRQLNEGLSLCQAAAFESRADGTFVITLCVI